MTASTFPTLGLTPELVQAARAQGLIEPTAVQAAAIGAVLARRDLQARAPTGSGKTAAYLLPLLQRQQAMRAAYPGEAPRRLRMLVVVPTRELAAQVGQMAQGLAAYLPLPVKIGVVFGGVSINPQMMALRGGADLVIATPGRLLDLLEHRALHFNAIDTLVLDEADRLLDLGFADEWQRILARLPAARQNLFFSATFPPDVAGLAAALLHEPLDIGIDAPPYGAAGADGESEGEGATRIVQRAIRVDPERRTELLRHLVAGHAGQRMLVFVASQYAAGHVAWKLYRNGIFATPFHGGLSQGARAQVLAEFKNQQWDVLVTTDLAARGIDIPQLPLVVNYDLPRSAVDYVHRIGRTGRAGDRGTAISFVGADAEAHFALIEKRQGQIIARETVEGFEPVSASLPTTTEAIARAAAGSGGVKGRRPNKKDRLRAAEARAKADAGDPGASADPAPQAEAPLPDTVPAGRPAARPAADPPATC